MGWVRFQMIRMAVFSLLFIAAVATLGLSAYQSVLFLKQKFDRPFLIFALCVSSVSVVASVGLSASRYSFKSHIGIIALLCILWLALASYATDRIGYVQCESLTGITHIRDNGEGYNAVAWCQELKAIMGLSWFSFGLLIIAIVSWIRLQEFEEREGLGNEPEEAREGFRAAEEENHQLRQELGPGFSGGVPLVNQGVPMTTGYLPPGVVQQPFATNGQGGQVVYQQPGYNVVLQNGTVRQVPVGAPLY